MSTGFPLHGCFIGDRPIAKKHQKRFKLSTHRNNYLSMHTYFKWMGYGMQDDVFINGTRTGVSYRINRTLDAEQRCIDEIHQNGKLIGKLY